jgi:hypothetical protein
MRDIALALLVASPLGTAACTTTTVSSPLVHSAPLAPPETSPAICSVTGATVLVDEASPGASAAMLGIVTHDPLARTFDERPLEDSPEGAARMRAPLGGPSGPEVLVPLDAERSLLVYVDDASSSPRLRAQPIARWGEAIGAPFDISPAGSSARAERRGDVRGPIRVALSPSGEGLVSYALREGARVDLAATPIACAPR